MSDITKPLQSKLRVLSDTARLERIQQLITEKNFASAIHEIDDLNGEILSAGRACKGLASKIAKRHWQPLFEGVANA